MITFTKKSFDTWQNIIKSYKEYKNLFNKDIVYPPDLLGLYIWLNFGFWIVMNLP